MLSVYCRPTSRRSDCLRLTLSALGDLVCAFVAMLTQSFRVAVAMCARIAIRVFSIFPLLGWHALFFLILAAGVRGAAQQSPQSLDGLLVRRLSLRRLLAGWTRYSRSQGRLNASVYGRARSYRFGDVVPGAQLVVYCRVYACSPAFEKSS